LVTFYGSVTSDSFWLQDGYITNRNGCQGKFMGKIEAPVTIRFSVDLKKKIKQHAAQAGRSLNKDVLWIIEDWLKAEERIAAAGQGKLPVPRELKDGIPVARIAYLEDELQKLKEQEKQGPNKKQRHQAG